MGNLKSGLADFLVSEYQNIQVKRARAIPNARRTVAAELLFDPQQAVEQRVGIERGLQDYHCIEKSRLFGKTHGLGGVQGRPSDHPAQRLEPSPCCGQRGLRIAFRTGHV